MAKLSVDKEGINTILFLLAAAADINGELSKAEGKLKKQCERALKPHTTSYGKAKGRDLQKFICRELAEMSGLDYNQQNDQVLIHSREMGQAGVDIILRGKAREYFPFSIECKNTEDFSVYAVVEQAAANQAEGTDWAIVHKKKQQDPIIVMAWAAFKRWYCKRGFLL